MDYQNADQALWTSLNKFKDHYNVAKSKSILRLSSFLYDLDQNFELTTCLKSGLAIWVQVESIKRRRKQKLSTTINEKKENLDPQVISARKKKMSKKNHNLNMNIAKNMPNWIEGMYLI